MSFPEKFIWGAASSAYQVEGAASEGGRSPSVWDTFCRRDGAVFHGHTGDVSCNHYHRVQEDVGLMKELGLQAYRFSLSWSRILPDGVGRTNAEGIAFYDRLIDELLTADIVPYVTLFHWDFPQILYDRGGWLNRDSADWFAEFAACAADAFTDRVQDWITLNEQACYIGLGHLECRHAPGDKLSFADAVQAGHHTLLAHGKAVQALRAHSEGPLNIGIAPVGMVSVPASDSEADLQAARTATLAITEKSLWSNTWWMDPVLLGRYPEDGLAVFGADAPNIEDGDMACIHQPLEFLGLNIYSGNIVQAGPDGEPITLPMQPGIPMTRFDWPVIPDVLRWGPRFLWERYEKPIMITENGMSGTDWVSLDGHVHDPQRIDFLQRYLQCLQEAVNDGAQIDGYFLWSIMDNFEWGEGYKERFGIIHVDFETGARTLKDSAHWYRDVIASNGSRLLPGKPEPELTS